MPQSNLHMLILGKNGQLATALVEHASQKKFIPHVLGSVDLDLSGTPEMIHKQILNSAKEASASIIVNAAAYTAVDKAEDDIETAWAVNATAPGIIAKAANSLGVPVVHISTDYVFDGKSRKCWAEDDVTSPLGVYGKSKLSGEQAVAEASDNHVILRTAWVYSPFGTNFVRTMLRLAAEGRKEIAVVSDQIGCPTSALDLADAILTIARNLVQFPQNNEMRGVFHLAGTNKTSWADFAREIFKGAHQRGAPSAVVKDILSSQYPTRAMRPANSSLNTQKIHLAHNINMPDWRISLDLVLDRLLGDKTEP